MAAAQHHPSGGYHNGLTLVHFDFITVVRAMTSMNGRTCLPNELSRISNRIGELTRTPSQPYNIEGKMASYRFPLCVLDRTHR